ncbi:MAG: MotA/TolQ/ExbB proton channel family protein [Gammaproteobacteria bacterium]|nr:MotA/TolQ/ExbB proton channel family protein [Gammaproteobacteria bacterium]
MTLLIEALASIRAFFELGGLVLYAILAVTAIMWALILERLWYLLRILPNSSEQLFAQWCAHNQAWHNEQLGVRIERWRCAQLRTALVSELGQAARRNLGLIESLMQALPLLGLLGTVWGMVHVFDIMTVYGTGNARLMANGVSRATIPTMSGLVAALSALYLVYWLRQRVKNDLHRFSDNLKSVPQAGGHAVPHDDLPGR